MISAETYNKDYQVARDFGYQQGRADAHDEMRNNSLAYQSGYEKGKADAIEEFAHLLKETFNNEFPTNYHCTQPYFTLDNVRVLVDLVAKEQK